MSVVLSFVVGVLSSVCAAGLVVAARRARYRLSFRSILHLIEGLGETIAKDGYRFDHLVTIGRNSGVAGSILAGQFGLSAAVSLSTSKRRLPGGERTIALDAVSEHTLDDLAEMNVLLFICCNDSGASLAYVVDRMNALGRPPAEIRTAALFTAPSPSFMPRYRAVVLEKDSRRSMSKVLTGLPWVTQRWLHPFGDERPAP